MRGEGVQLGLGGGGQRRRRVEIRERQIDKVKEIQVERSEEKGNKGPSQGGNQSMRSQDIRIT